MITRQSRKPHSNVGPNTVVGDGVTIHTKTVPKAPATLTGALGPPAAWDEGWNAHAAGWPLYTQDSLSSRAGWLARKHVTQHGDESK